MYTKKLSKSTKCGTHLRSVCSLSHSLLYHGTVVKSRRRIFKRLLFYIFIETTTHQLFRFFFVRRNFEIKLEKSLCRQKCVAWTTTTALPLADDHLCSEAKRPLRTRFSRFSSCWRFSPRTPSSKTWRKTARSSSLPKRRWLNCSSTIPSRARNGTSRSCTTQKRSSRASRKPSIGIFTYRKRV